MATPSSSSGGEDRIVWQYMPNDKFTVASAYTVAYDAYADTNADQIQRHKPTSSSG